MKLRLHRIRTDSRNILSLDIPDVYQNWYAMLVGKGSKIGDWYDVDISLPRRHRSTGYKSANHHFNGHIQQICVETGNSFEDVKLYVKRQAFAQGLPFMTHLDGSPVLSLVDGQPLPISETDMDSIQCGWCIDATHILAGELGIVLEEE